MKRRNFLMGGAAGVLTLAASKASAQDVTTLRLHTLVPVQTSMIASVVQPWATRIEEASGGRIKIEIYGSMSLGGSPQSLYDQVKDHVVDFTFTSIGYTPGRFPKTETFELPFLMTNGEQTSVAMQRFVEENSLDEFAGTKPIAIITHGPGLLHLKNPVERLEDLKGMKVRGGSRIVNDMLAAFGAEPITIPITQLAEALTTGVLDGTTLPWDITLNYKTSELVHHHLEFGGKHGLYTQVLMFVMSGEAYNALAPDLQALFDKEPGVDIARQLGVITDERDRIARQAAVDLGNTIVTLDEAETQRFVDASQVAVENWYKESEGRGIDGRALHARAKELVAEESGIA
jgi:TRAP-type C4-dicarboxylate transport system substrate-binding protein